jgi:4-amino-4-deoxy-L-arabinose transferase-like glycosyltransferase
MAREEYGEPRVITPVQQQEERVSRMLAGAVVLLIIAGTLGAAFGGPALSDHEAIVALCARNMRLSGDWVVPEYLGTPWFRKPPLPYWLIAAVSYVLPNDPRTGLPVSTMAARLPTALSAFATVLLLWHLAASMFGKRVGMVAAVITGSSLMFLLYGVNATPEMLLTMCCTWAFLHFWYAATTRNPRKRFLHAMFFYVAMAFGMLAKGPAPIAVTAFPLAVWWYTQRSLRFLAHKGPGGWREAMVLFFRDLVPRTMQVFTRLHLVPGLIVFAAVFVPWMLEVAKRHPHAWDLWNWQYWQRAQGNYEDTRDRGLLYYPPLVAGLVVPWLFLIPEALAAPWMKRYARQRSGLLFGGLLAVMGVGAMSLMPFKKPYYILPAVPGLLLLMAVVADRFFGRTARDGPLILSLRVGSRRRNLIVPDERRFAWGVWMVLAVGSVATVIAAGIWMHRRFPGFAAQWTWIAAGVLIIILFAGITFIRGHGWTAVGILALASIVAFHTVWYCYAPAIDTLDEVDKVAALARGLDAAGVPPDAKVLWADRRPDARLSFYHNRHSTYMVTPDEIVSRMVDRTNQKRALQELVLDRANALLGAVEPVYLILERRHYDQLSSLMLHKGRLVASVGSEFEREGKHWVAVSNASRP